MKIRDYAVIAGALLALVACFLPWMVGSGESLNGFREELGNPGRWLLVGAGFRLLLFRMGGRIAGIFKALVAIGLAFILLDAFKTAIRIEGAAPGIGLWLALIGVLLMLFPRRWPFKQGPKA